MAAPDNDSLRLALIKAITTYLEEEVKPDNGYKNTLAGKVMRGLAVHSANQMQVPCISVFEGVNSRRAEEGADRRDVGGNEDPLVAYDQMFNISGWTKAADKKFPTDEAYELMADVKKAIGKKTRELADEGPTFDGLVTGMIVDPGIVLPVEDVNAYPQFVLRINVQIVEAVADPYRTVD